MQGEGQDVPIKVLQEQVDFRCCVFNQVYRDEVVVRNSGRAAMKASVAMCPELADFIEFTPSFGFVQAGREFPFSIKLLAKPKCLQRCRKFITDSTTNEMVIPLQVRPLSRSWWLGLIMCRWACCLVLVSFQRSQCVCVPPLRFPTLATYLVLGPWCPELSHLGTARTNGMLCRSNF